MSQPDGVPEPWFSFLKELDALATSTVRLDCLGGFVVTMLYGLRRPTADVDVLEIAPLSAAEAFGHVAMQGGELHKKYGIYLDRVTVAQAPYEYESRLKEMFPAVFEHLRLMALDPYAWHSPNLNAISNAIAMTFDTWRVPFHSICNFSENAI